MISHTNLAVEYSLSLKIHNAMKDYKIFMLHRVLPEFAPNNYYFLRKTAISWQCFIGFLDKIESMNWQVKPLSTIKFCNPKRDVFISFDDGYADNHFALHEIHRRGMSATLFPVKIFSQTNFSPIDDMAHHLMKSEISNTTKKSLLDGRLKRLIRKLDPLQYRRLRKDWFEVNEDAQHGQLFMSETDLKYWCKSGIELGIHGTSHRVFTSLTPQQLNKELTISRTWLYSLGAQACLPICFPHGKYNNQVIKQCNKFTSFLIGVDAEKSSPSVYRRIQICENNN